MMSASGVASVMAARSAPEATVPRPRPQPGGHLHRPADEQEDARGERRVEDAGAQPAEEVGDHDGHHRAPASTIHHGAVGGRFIARSTRDRRRPIAQVPGRLQPAQAGPLGREAAGHGEDVDPRRLEAEEPEGRGHRGQKGDQHPAHDLDALGRLHVRRGAHHQLRAGRRERAGRRGSRRRRRRGGGRGLSFASCFAH